MRAFGHRLAGTAGSYGLNAVASAARALEEADIEELKTAHADVVCVARKKPLNSLAQRQGFVVYSGP